MQGWTLRMVQYSICHFCPTLSNIHYNVITNFSFFSMGCKAALTRHSFYSIVFDTRPTTNPDNRFQSKYVGMTKLWIKPRTSPVIVTLTAGEGHIVELFNKSEDTVSNAYWLRAQHK